MYVYLHIHTHLEDEVGAEETDFLETKALGLPLLTVTHDFLLGPQSF